MRDLLLILIFSGLLLVVWQRAWLGVLILVVLAYLNPQSYADGFFRTLPLFEICFLLTLIRFILDRHWMRAEWLREHLYWLKDWRVILIILLWLQTGLSTFYADVPDMAGLKWVDFSKILASLILTPLLIDNRRKLNWLAITIGLSISLIALKGGFWSLINGQGGRIFGPGASEFDDNNLFAIAALMAVPLLFILLDGITDKKRRQVVIGLILLCLLSILATWSRGAFLALVVSAIVFIFMSNKKLVLIAPALVLMLGSFYLMPDGWFERMGSIANYASGESEAGRVGIWKEGISRASERPLVGLGFDGWRRFSKLDWHSSYVESFAEHGVIGFLLWFSLLYGSMLKLFLLARNDNNQVWVRTFSISLLTGLTAYSVGSVFLGITYWSLMYQLVLMSVILSRVQLVPDVAEFRLVDSR